MSSRLVFGLNKEKRGVMFLKGVGEIFVFVHWEDSYRPAGGWLFNLEGNLVLTRQV